MLRTDKSLCRDRDDLAFSKFTRLGDVIFECGVLYVYYNGDLVLRLEGEGLEALHGVLNDYFEGGWSK